jgi:putative ABC transport system permease protein
MLFIALKRLWHRPLLTLLSIAGVVLAVSLVSSIPLFARAVTFRVLQEELESVSLRTGRPLFQMRVYAYPSDQYPLSVRDIEAHTGPVQETFASQVGLPVVASSRQIESMLLELRTGDTENPYGSPRTVLREHIALCILPGVESHLDIVQGVSMDDGTSADGVLDVWMHHEAASNMGIEPGEAFVLYNPRRAVPVSVRIAGIWRARDPQNRQFWFSDPDVSLNWSLLVREADYRDIVEPAFNHELGLVSWYLIMDEGGLEAERLEAYLDGMDTALKIAASFLPRPRLDSTSPQKPLEETLAREAELMVVMFVLSLPVMGFLIYFISLISTMAMRWQRREAAIMASRGMRGQQLLIVGLVESLIIAGIGCLSGVPLGIPLARLIGYTESFLRFAKRAPLEITPTALNVPLILLALVTTIVARLWPLLRSARASVVAYERRRSRASQKPFWQRFYLDFLLLAIALYAYRRLVLAGTLVPEALPASAPPGTAPETLRAAPEVLREVTRFLRAMDDPLLFLVPTLFALACALLLVRLFPLLAWVGDCLGRLSRGTALYLAFRQLSRNSGQYTSALLLVITALGLGAYMASTALSLDQWLIDREYYAVGADVWIEQMPRPPKLNEPIYIPPPPDEGAWALPVSSYLDLPGVVDAARVGMYPCRMFFGPQLWQLGHGTFVGLDRLDAPRVVFFRPDFAPGRPGGSMVTLMNELAQRQDGVLLSESVLARSGLAVGDKLRMHVEVADFYVDTEFVVAGTYKYFPTVFEAKTDRATAIGNLEFLFGQIGATLLHDIWLRTMPGTDIDALIREVRAREVYVRQWKDVPGRVVREQAKMERVGMLGTLNVGFIAAAVLSGIGLLVYNYASLQERLRRFAVLCAVGLSRVQVIAQVAIEYVVLMIYAVAGGTTIGVLAAKLFVPFFQAADENILDPPPMVPLIAWAEIARIAGVFISVLLLAQFTVIVRALRRGAFQALRMGDQE